MSDFVGGNSVKTRSRHTDLTYVDRFAYVVLLLVAGFDSEGLDAVVIENYLTERISASGII